MLLLPSLAIAQGQVTRKPKPNPVKPTPKAKPKINSMTAAQKQRIINNLINNMVYVSGGTFTMGTNSENVYSEEKPVHRVTLSSYYIGKYEVTQEEWKAVMGSNPSNFKGG